MDFITTDTYFDAMVARIGYTPTMPVSGKFEYMTGQLMIENMGTLQQFMPFFTVKGDTISTLAKDYKMSTPPDPNAPYDVAAELTRIWGMVFKVNGKALLQEYIDGIGE